MKFSASAAGITASHAQLFKPKPSVVSWSRLEPLATRDDPAESLQARLADPLWMLARQWQFNEFQGEDAGSPVNALLTLSGLPMSTLHPARSSPNAASVAPQPLAGQAPIEALVEREQVLAAHPKLNAQAGQHLLRMLRVAGHGATVQQAVRDNYPAHLATPSDPAADTAGFVWHQLLDQASVDALALAADLRALAGDANAMEAFAGGLGLDAGATAGVAEVLGRWLDWLDALALGADQAGASPYWNPQRQEYAFELGAAGSAPAFRLMADDYTDGKLEWHSFSVGGLPTPEPGVFKALDISPSGPLLPTTARYSGMPADRYWEFEDGRVNFGIAGASKTDLTRLAILEYALVFGNDWFVLPLKLAVGAVYRVRDFRVRDNFGGLIPIPAATNPNGSQWTMFELSAHVSSPRSRLGDLMYLCPAVETLESAALEHVVVMRDEMANLVWAIEKRVQGSAGEALERRLESTRLSTDQALSPAPGAPPSTAPLRYRLQTPVAAHWIPLLPVQKKEGSVLSIQLQRGVVTHHYQVDPLRLADPRNADVAEVVNRLKLGALADQPFVEASGVVGPAENPLQAFMFHPRGSLLRRNLALPVMQDYLRIDEEEVPRDGIELKRCFNYARGPDGRAWLWIGRSKTTGRGEGASDLRFDVVDRQQGS